MVDHHHSNADRLRSPEEKEEEVDDDDEEEREERRKMEREETLREDRQEVIRFASASSSLGSFAPHAPARRQGIDRKPCPWSSSTSRAHGRGPSPLRRRHVESRISASILVGLFIFRSSTMQGRRGERRGRAVAQQVLVLGHPRQSRKACFTMGGKKRERK